MYNQKAGDRSIVDKMMRLFIIQAISGFVSRDFDTGIHFLNEVKTHFAQNQTSLNPTLKLLAKEIINSLDMYAPGATADIFRDGDEQTDLPSTPQAELTGTFKKPKEKSKRDTKEEPSGIRGVFKRRKKRKEQKGSTENLTLEEALDLGDLEFNEVPKEKVETVLEDRKKRRQKNKDLWDDLEF